MNHMKWILLAAVILIVACADAKRWRKSIVSVKPKAGKCPVRDPNIAVKCAPGATNACENDACCKGEQKCCKLYCVQECFDPVPKVKPGQCPVPPKYIITTSDVTCFGDDTCPGSQKCCNWGDRIVCLEPAASNTVTCPKVAQVNCLVADPRYCESDAQCPKNSKCCTTTQCGGTNCRPTALTQKPGACPAPPYFCTKVYQPDDCKTDSDCFEQNKCCKMCKKECVAPASPKGSCPVRAPDDPNFCMTARVASDCSPYVACTGGKMCCPGACGSSRCQDPVKPKCCPAFEVVDPEFCERSLWINGCATDANCSNGQTCCPGPCGTRRCQTV